MSIDVVIAGGGPAGLAAALTLGRARKRVVLCDAGPRRNAAAVHMHGFVTRDGATPDEFRRVGRAQLAAYPSVEVRDEALLEVTGERGAFQARTAGGAFTARRVLLCTGMIDEVPAIEGAAALWGHRIFQCPYCHAWEVRGQRFGYLATNPEMAGFALLLRGWTSDVVVFTGGQFALPGEQAAQLAAAGVAVEARPIARLRAAADGGLAGVELADGGTIARDVLFAHPRQRQVALVTALGVALTPAGHVAVDDARRETSVAGIYAGGDLVSPLQSAIVAASSGTHAAAMLNHGLTVELATRGLLA